MRTDFTIAEDGKWTAAACSARSLPEHMEKCGAQFAAQLFFDTRWELKKDMRRSTEVSMTKEEADAISKKEKADAIPEKEEADEIPENEEDWESSDSDDSYVEPVYYPTVKEIYDS